MTLTHAQMVASINAGGVVSYRGRTIGNVNDVPSDAQILIDVASDVAGTPVWYVDAVNGGDSKVGTDPDHALATIMAAHALASEGDRILIMPGSYGENLIITKDYLSLVGAFAGGYAKPDIEAESGISLLVRAQGFVASHVRFAGASDVVKQQGNGFLFEDCVFDGDGNGAADALIRLVGDNTNTHLTASEGIVRKSLLRGSGGLGIIFDTAAPVVGVGSTDNLIEENKFVGNAGIDIATKDTGAGTYSIQNGVIRKNLFADKNKTCYIDLTTANGGAASDQTGVIAENVFAADAITGTEVKMAGTGFVFAMNGCATGIVDGSSLD